MDDLITRLRFYGEPNLPATPEQIQDLSRALECELDPFLVQLYLAHDGQADSRRVVAGEDGTEVEKDLGFALMPIGEVLHLYGIIRGARPGEHGFVPYRYSAFWEGDEWMACYLDGPMRGKVFRYGHDGPRVWIPLYRSPRSFCEALVKAVETHDEYSIGDFADHDPINAPPEGDDPADTAVALELIEACRTCDDPYDQGFFANCAAALLPHHDTALLAALANDENPRVRDAVGKVLRERREEHARAEHRRAGGSDLRPATAREAADCR
jgi:hypothetical protein